MEIDLNEVKKINQIEDWNAKILSAALMYANAGFYVVPIRPNGKAIPGKRFNFNYAHASRKPEIMMKWFGPGAMYEGWNIGLAAGRYDGIFVVDVDRHGNTDGLETWEQIRPENYDHSGPVQQTPSGGVHLVYQWGQNGRCSTGKLGPGLDTRGGEEAKCQGHIVAWPSVVDGKPYDWVSGGELRGMPDWVSSLMGASWKGAEDGSGRGNEEMSKADLETKFSIDQLRELISWIHPDELSYQEWVNVGMVIHTQHPTRQGAELFDEWSQTGERYEPNEVRARWSGFNPNGPVRIGTVIYMAKARGWSHHHIEHDTSEQDELVDTMNKEFAVVPMGSEVMVLQEKEVIPELARIQPCYQIYKRAAFRALLENQIIIAADNEGKVRKWPVADVWLAHENRRTYPNGMGLFPGRGKRYHGYYNLWSGFVVKPEPGDWSLFEQHIRNVICKGDNNITEWVLDWIADLYQDPANPKGCAVILSGIEGCGKGTFAQMVGYPFGTHFKHLTDEEHFVGRFNGHLADCVFAFADEVTYGGNKKVAGKLKALVTERFITTERKGVDAVQYHNCAHVVVASNEKWFIPAGPQSRRWLVLDVSGRFANDRKYFDAIHRQMEQEGGLAAMLHDLLQRKVTHNLQKAPDTEALMEQRAALSYTDSVVAWLVSVAGPGVLNVPTLDEVLPEDEGSWPDAVAKADVMDAYESWCEKQKYRRAVNPNTFYKSMNGFGFRAYKARRGDQRIPAYEVPKLDTLRSLIKQNTGVDLIGE